MYLAPITLDCPETDVCRIMKPQRGRRIEDAWMDLGVLKGGWSLAKSVLDKLV